MRVSVVVVNFRSSSLISSLLSSFGPDEQRCVESVVIVDNESGDESVSFLKDRIGVLGIGTWVKVVESGRNGGFGFGNNVGFKTLLATECMPDVVWLLNPDTLVSGVDLRAALQWFESDENVAIVGTALIDEVGIEHLSGHRRLTPVGEFVRLAGAFGVLRRFSTSDPSLNQPGYVDWVSGASLLIRRDVFQATGGFDEDFFLYFEEVDLCERVKKRGYKICYEPQVKVRHFEGKTTGVTGRADKPGYWYRSRGYYFLKHFGRPGLLFADLAWLLGRFVGFMRGRGGDGCRFWELVKHDFPLLLFGLRESTGVSQ